MQMKYKKLHKEFWGRHLRARGYFRASSGDVTDEIIQEYIQNHFLPNCANAYPSGKPFKQAELKPAPPAFAEERGGPVRVNICHGDETIENRRA